jgi:hypothetical protein
MCNRPECQDALKERNANVVGTTQPKTERRKNTYSFMPPLHDSTQDMNSWMYTYHIVTCRPISRKQVDEYVSWDTKIKDVDS